MKKIRIYRESLGWSEWQSFDKADFSDENLIEAVEISEEMTLKEMKEHYPELIDALNTKEGSK